MSYKFFCAKIPGKYQCRSLFFNKAADMRPVTLLKKETLAEVFSCESWVTFKNVFFAEPLQESASDLKLEFWGFLSGKYFKRLKADFKIVKKNLINSLRKKNLCNC